jgi:AcrR family transcriptional regulator
MARTGPARLPGTQRRTLIETAAARLFAERGYAGTRLDDVAAASGVTKPMVYRHFASKKALYLALLDRHRADQLSIAGTALTGEPLRPRLRDLLDAWFAQVQEHPDTWRMIFRDTTGDAEIRRARLEVQANAHALITAALAAQPDGGLGDDERDAAAELLRSAMAGLALWLLNEPRRDRAAPVDLMVRATLGVLEPPADESRADSLSALRSTAES